MVEKRETYMDKARRLWPEVFEDDKLEYLARLYARIDWLQTELDYKLLKEDIEEVREKNERLSD